MENVILGQRAASYTTVCAPEHLKDEVRAIASRFGASFGPYEVECRFWVAGEGFISRIEVRECIYGDAQAVYRAEIAVRSFLNGKS